MKLFWLAITVFWQSSVLNMPPRVLIYGVFNLVINQKCRYYSKVLNNCVDGINV